MQILFKTRDPQAKALCDQQRWRLRRGSDSQRLRQRGLTLNHADQQAE